MYNITNRKTTDTHKRKNKKMGTIIGIVLACFDLSVEELFYDLFEDASEVDVNTVDVLNSLDGDANEDGETDLADATAIIQAIGNPAKYALSAQGEFNADTDGNGLTGADAIAIQYKEVIMKGMPE